MTRNIGLWRGTWLFLLAACCFPAVGQLIDGTMSGLQNMEGQKPHTVGGVVLNSVTGEPIYRALVEIGTQFATLTDHEGRFELEGVTTGAWPFVRKPGYSPDYQSAPYISDALRPPGDAPMVVKLIPEAILSGTVTGADDEPLESVEVQLKALAVNRGAWHWMEQQATRTNSEGQYRFTDLVAGKYAVASMLHMEGLPNEPSASGYMPTRYPAVAPQFITLAPGQHIEANLNPGLERTYAVTGTIRGYGETGINFNVVTAAGEEIRAATQFNVRTGQFQVALPSGTYKLNATAYLPQGSQQAQLPLTRGSFRAAFNAARSTSQQAQLPLTVHGAAIHGLSIALGPSAQIPVEVVAVTVNQPAEGAVSVLPMRGLQLLNADPLGPLVAFFATAPVRPTTGTNPPSADEDPFENGVSAWLFDSVPAGRYQMEAQTGPPWYISSATCGGADLMQEDLVVGDGSAGCSIRVSLRNDAGSVHISIRQPAGDESARAVQFYILPLDNRIGRVYTTVSQEKQWTQFVAPGRYVALALGHMQELAYRDPETLRRCAALGQEITVTPNGKAEIEVSLVNGEL